jgi:hypothetical protein
LQINRFHHSRTIAVDIAAVEAAIEQIASQTVASIVVEVTDDKSLPKAERERCKSSRHKSREAN